MKAITHNRYGGPNGLTMTDVSLPSVGPSQVLIRVHAVGLNAYDWHMYRGEPTIMRLSHGLRIKDRRIPGADVAGVIEEIGRDVTGFGVGDRVLAEPGAGGCAQFAVAEPDAVARLAEHVDFSIAAAAPMGALTSLQALRDTGQLRPDESVLVWGASGGVGHLAVQVARALGARQVDAVCSGKNVAMVRDLGADDVFDYAAREVPDARPQYDVILDTVATHPLRELKPMLKPGGRYVTVGALGGGKVLGPLTPMVRRTLRAKATRVDSRGMLAKPNSADLAIIAGWLADGTIRPVIQQEFSLPDTADACRELERGHVAGKLVIQVA